MEDTQTTPLILLLETSKSSNNASVIAKVSNDFDEISMQEDADATKDDDVGQNLNILSMLSEQSSPNEMNLTSDSSSDEKNIEDLALEVNGTATGGAAKNPLAIDFFLNLCLICSTIILID